MPLPPTLAPLSALLLSGSPPAPSWFPPATELNALAEKAWKDRAPPVGKRPWSVRLTPAFPAHWPLQGPGSLVVYAFADSFSPQLMDGVHVARPWAVLKLAPGKAPSVESLQEATELGIQGIKPISGQEVAIYKTEREAQGKLASWVEAGAAPAEPDPMVKAYYCQWLRYNGVVAGALREAQASFVGWLRCGG